MFIEIESKYGTKKVFFDEEDFILIGHKKWRIVRGGHNIFYATTSYYLPEKKNSTNRFMHNVIMKHVGIDHIDGDGLNNCRSNLRIATQSQNAKNQRVKITNKFGVKGVSFDKKKRRYSAYITFNYKRKFLGYYNSIVDAAMAYDAAASLYFGEFARLNNLSEERISSLRKFDINGIVVPLKLNNTSGYRGVLSVYGGKFAAKISYNKKQIRLGIFNSSREAAEAYNLASIKYYGANALLNDLT